MGGFGVTPQIAEEVLALDVEVMTSGNHIWDKKEILEYLDQQPRLLRPHNYPNGVPGRGTYVGVARNGCRVATINLQGRVFMAATDCPFRTADRELERLRRETPVIIVDFHAEATSEKASLRTWRSWRFINKEKLEPPSAQRPPSFIPLQGAIS